MSKSSLSPILRCTSTKVAFLFSILIFIPCETKINPEKWLHWVALEYGTEFVLSRIDILTGLALYSSEND